MRVTGVVKRQLTIRVQRLRVGLLGPPAIAVILSSGPCATLHSIVMATARRRPQGVKWHFDRNGWLPRFARDWAVVVALGTLALLAFAKVGEDVLEHETIGFDGAVQRWVIAHQYPALVKLFYWVTTAGGVGPMSAIAVLGALYLWRRGKPRVASTVLIAPAVAVGLFSAVKQLYARPRPVGLSGIVSSSYSFPSGHATASTAICCTLAYVYWREGFVSRTVALSFAIVVPLLIGISRVYLNVHWATDVLGGWSAGLLIAVLSAALYDRNRRRPLPR
jgi:undecaprenyl-diphosphatase